MKKTLALLFASLCMCTTLMAQSEGFVEHMVKWYEDINIISAKYGVPVDVIVKINKLDEAKVQNRQKLIIPTDEKYWPEDKDQAVETEDVADKNSDSTALYTVACPTESFNLGVYLPFSTGSDGQRAGVMDFYGGLLLGVKEMADDGMCINLDVRDTAREEEMSSPYASDIVIGPFRSNDFELIAQEDSTTLLVSPLDPKTAGLAASKSNVVQLAASNSGQYEFALEYNDGDNFIIISSDMDTAGMNDVTRALDAKNIPYTLCKCWVQGEIEGWANAYKEDLTNKVILAINSEAVLNNAIRNMCIEENKGNIVCYAGNKVTSYESIPVENIHRAHIHVLCSYYVDYNDANVQDFIQKYRALYNSDPSQYAFQGRDLAVFLAATWREYGKAWANLINTREQMNLLQSSFKLIRTENGGLVNVGARKLEYQRDFKLVLK